VVAVVLAVLAAGTTAGILAWRAGQGKPGPTASAPVQTATVQRMNLSTAQTLTGTLGYSTAEPLNGVKSGVITWLPAAGATVTRGQPLYRVDNLPVPLFYGATPLYRELSITGTVGPDVKMVADNLVALGYDIGYQPPVGAIVTEYPPVATSPSTGPTASPQPSATGTGGKALVTTGQPTTATVEPGDAVLTDSLKAAIARWQTAEGLPASGTLNIGDVITEQRAIRVTELQAQVGAQATGALMMVAPTAKTVTVPVDSTNVSSIAGSGPVIITLPDGSTTRGTITSISDTVQSGNQTSDGLPQQTITVSPGDSAAVAGIDAASVQVTFTGQTRDGVLAVPVVALLALSGGGYAVQLPGGHLIPVQTGIFAQGMVQVSGPGLVAGLRVVTGA
jgi:hypothetical protein